MTQLLKAKQGVITPEMERVSGTERQTPEFIRAGIAEGNIIITQNIRHTSAKPLGIGKGLTTKVNANIGTSGDHADIEEELQKLEVAIAAGADTVMDLSVGGPVNEVRREVLARSSIPVGTVPIYQAALSARHRGKSFVELNASEIFETIEQHAHDGVDFVTVHCTVTQESVARLKKHRRILDIVSRGGALMFEWMAFNKKENPLYEHFDRLLSIAKKYDMSLSLGDGMRPGCLADATDRGQIQELILQGELVERCWEAGVQVMCEGPGHVPLDQVAANMILQKRLCRGAPFYVLGPLVTDIAPGYDHITGAIGGALAAVAGADFLCYVTPSEHLRLPSIQDVREGVIASRIAAHAADIARGIPGAMERDNAMARCRKKLDWEGQISLAIDPERARTLRESSRPADSDVCTMCGEFCAIKVTRKATGT
ncbi:MAG: phosphomethylpyrimidine synthase ThiC [Candidatus Abyssobacteria bacterium SURF_17]|uniref:Phosphomethylpyrimidine synthase n=1 Tax=Candidatus Abyssobacteria bacterium SURF_17 TaxID=2093361 RepID=A0A419ENK1_9BACT|nr:MAG: phosphomethylpyrimidine synthase ThiC [Candidatus Abyssubacteria bacterium SURF_17]